MRITAGWCSTGITPTTPWTGECLQQLHQLPQSWRCREKTCSSQVNSCSYPWASVNTHTRKGESGVPSGPSSRKLSCVSSQNCGWEKTHTPSHPIPPTGRERALIHHEKTSWYLEKGRLKVASKCMCCVGHCFYESHGLVEKPWLICVIEWTNKFKSTGEFR